MSFTSVTPAYTQPFMQSLQQPVRFAEGGLVEQPSSPSPTQDTIDFLSSAFSLPTSLPQPDRTGILSMADSVRSRK